VIAAFDIGGTHVAAALVDPGSASVIPGSRLRVELPDDGSRADLLRRLERAAAAVATAGVEVCGVAAPGPFDYERGIPRLRHKLTALYGVDLRRELSGWLGIDPDAVSFVNDADAFALGEWHAGAVRGRERVVGITLGTGLGSAFLAGGRIVDTGPDVPPEGSLHLASFRDAPVEERISRGGLLARYHEPSLDVEHVAERARAGEPAAAEAFDWFAAELAEFLIPWLVRFDADSVVVGGSIARAWDLLEPVVSPALATVESLELVTVAENLDDAPLLGAALHAASRVES
jgi:glucokinase